MRLQLRQHSLAVVTPWQNHLELHDDYFAAVSELGDRDELVIVDDASTEPLPFAKIRLEKSRGFCGASNAGLHHASADVVLFLNNDVVPIAPGWINQIREAVKPGVLAGPLRNGWHTAIDGTCYAYIDGWCLAGMRGDFLELGGFSELLEEPAYYSDNLLCLEAQAAGMSLRDVRVTLEHKENTTAGPAWTDRVRAATRTNRARYEARVREIIAAIPK